jgi:hypothetical protein
VGATIYFVLIVEAGALRRGLLSLYAWFLGAEVRASEYAVGSVERPVVWIDSDRWSLAGQHLFGTILLNESRLGKMPDEVVDYVFLHEVGHGQLSRPLRALVSLLRYLLMMTAVFTLPPMVGLLIAATVTSPLPVLDPLVAVYTVGVALVLVPLVTVSWLDEGYAEAYAISQVGYDEYLQITQELRRRSESSQIKRVLHTLIYPPPRLVVWGVGHLSLVRAAFQ